MSNLDSTDKSEVPISPNGAELVIAFVAAVGVNLTIAENAVTSRLKQYNYFTEEVKITRDVLPKLYKEASGKFSGDFERIQKMMNLGNDARRDHGTEILAQGIAAEISSRRSEGASRPGVAYIVHSLKHPDEVRKLRSLYPRGFHLIGVHAHPDMRKKHLMDVRKMSEDEAKSLMDRDKKEAEKHGQQLNATFHLADFFIGWNGDDKVKVTQSVLDLGEESVSADTSEHQINSKRVVSSVDRFIDILFGHRYKTPTFGEYAMFMAYSASLRSADLSRQVGAVIARDSEILSTGANDCPTSGGGLYWPRYNLHSSEIVDDEGGRDYMRGFDSNRKEQDELIAEIVDQFGKDVTNDGGIQIDEAALSLLKDSLSNGALRNLTEYGRVVHAEMEAILACARRGISTKGATIYCTTFPCHNCAKHIIASGIRRVVFVEPYLKSKATGFHKDSIVINYPQDDVERKIAAEGDKERRVKFEPFFGVGPRRFFEFFSMSLGVSEPLTRKNSSGDVIPWKEEEASPRLQMQSVSYLELEKEASDKFNAILKI